MYIVYGDAFFFAKAEFIHIQMMSACRPGMGNMQNNLVGMTLLASAHSLIETSLIIQNSSSEIIVINRSIMQNTW